MHDGRRVNLDAVRHQAQHEFGFGGHLLADVEWDLHPGALTTYGDWQVENQEEFCHAAAGRLGIVREACAKGAVAVIGNHDEAVAGTTN